MRCVFLCSADGEKSQDYDEERAEEDEPPGEEGGSRPTRVRYETQALALRKAESWEEGQAVAAPAAAASWQGGGRPASSGGGSRPVDCRQRGHAELWLLRCPWGAWLPDVGAAPAPVF